LEGHARLYRPAGPYRRAHRASGRSYLGAAEHYAVTYGDRLADADLGAELAYHLSHGKVGTVPGVNPASRLGEFRMDGSELVEFVEEPELHSAWINGGYFFFHSSFDEYLSLAEDCVLAALLGFC
jgi:glucose-1-phosphate cytidylyltransferase